MQQIKNVKIDASQVDVAWNLEEIIHLTSEWFSLETMDARRRRVFIAWQK